MQQQATAAAAAAGGGPIICTHGYIRRAIECEQRNNITTPRDYVSIHQTYYFDTVGRPILDKERADQQSVQCLINHLRANSLRELYLEKVLFSDEGFNVLLEYFASNTTTSPLTTVSMLSCDFGRTERASQQLLAAIGTSASAITYLKVVRNSYTRGETLENSILDSDILAGLLQKDNPPLETLCLNEFVLQVRNADALRQALRNITHLTFLDLSYCQIDAAHVHVIADGLDGNTTLEVLHIKDHMDIRGINSMDSNAFLLNITRIVESTQVKELSFALNLTNGETVQVQSFATGLSTNTFMKTLHMGAVRLSTSVVHEILQGLEHNSTLENLDLARIVWEEGDVLQIWTSLPRIHGLRSLNLCPFDWRRILENPSLSVPAFRENTSLETLHNIDLANIYGQYEPQYTEIRGCLVRNRSNRLVRLANALLALQPRTGLPIASKSGIWYMAIAKLGPASRDHPSAAASAIFHILHMRPAIFELQLKRPSSSTQQGSSASSSHRRRRRRRRRPRAGAQQEHALDGSNNNVDEDDSSDRVGEKRARRS